MREILEMLAKKWKIRCNLMETEGKGKEKRNLRERCTEQRDKCFDYSGKVIISIKDYLERRKRDIE